MKIVITGGLGHIGSKLIRVLPKYLNNTKIVIIDNLMSKRFCSLFNLPKHCDYEFFDSDVCNSQSLKYLDGADILIHLAAITDAEKSFVNSSVVEENNFVSTKVLSDFCAENDIKFLHISSTSVYGTQSALVDESCSAFDLKPQSPYALTKLKEEQYIKDLFTNKSLKSISCRFGTIFGVSPGMRFHTAVNKFVWQAIHKKPLTIWRTAFNQKRPYLDLNDAINLIFFIIRENIFDGEIYNILSLNATVETIVEAIRKYKPDLELSFVDSKIMNQLSYEVSSKKIEKRGFRFKGDLNTEIENYFKMLDI